MAGVLPQKRAALADSTNDGSEFGRDEKHPRASIEGQLAEDVSPLERAKRIKTAVNYVGNDQDADKACGVEEAPESSEDAEQEDAWEKGSESGYDSAEDDDNDESEEEEDVASEEEEEEEEEEENGWYDSSKNKPPPKIYKRPPKKNKPPPKPIIPTAPKELDEPWNNLTDKEETAVLRAINDSDSSDSHKIIRSRAEVLLSVPCGSLKAKTPAILGLMQVMVDMGLDREEKRKAEMSAPQKRKAEALVDKDYLSPVDPHTCGKQQKNKRKGPVGECKSKEEGGAFIPNTKFMPKKDVPEYLGYEAWTDMTKQDQRGHNWLKQTHEYFVKYRIYEVEDAHGNLKYFKHEEE